MARAISFFAMAEPPEDGEDNDAEEDIELIQIEEGELSADERSLVGYYWNAIAAALDPEGRSSSVSLPEFSGTVIGGYVLATDLGDIMRYYNSLAVDLSSGIYVEI